MYACLFVSAETTVVIIVSVSLALLVYAIIPLIFYAHCRIDPGEVTHAHPCYFHSILRCQTKPSIYLCLYCTHTSILMNLVCLFQMLKTKLKHPTLG